MARWYRVGRGFVVLTVVLCGVDFWRAIFSWIVVCNWILIALAASLIWEFVGKPLIDKIRGRLVTAIKRK